MSKTWLAELWATAVHQKFCCVFAGASCDILVQRAAHWLQGFERRRGGQGRIATSGTTQPLKRDLMLEWALRIGLESFLCICVCVGGMFYASVYGRKRNRYGEKERQRKKGSIKVDVWLHGVASLCVSSLCDSASNVNRSVIRNSKHMPSWGRPLSLSPVLHTAHIMHCIKYLLVFVRRGLHFLQKNNQNKKRGPCFLCLCLCVQGRNDNGQHCNSLPPCIFTSPSI